ncbi:aldehyde dehydrogenase family protein [Amycolatopsis sp. NPDC059090]|uniref:aldehyde dehydrogenase family protein n=1 Tax=unclassified Amycolatopsis TaxID=2618356 RepID=UPI00366BED12
MRTYDQLFLGSRWTEPATADTFEIRSPHDRALVGIAPKAATADVDRAVAAARRALEPWGRTPLAERLRLVERFNELHAARADEIAELVTAENGSPSWFTGWTQHNLPERTAAWLELAREFSWEATLTDEAGNRTIVRAAPVGVVAAVIPWNSPHSAALVKLIPALLAGNPVLLKAAPETALDAMVLAEIFEQAGFPEGVVSVFAADRDVSEHLVTHPGVDKIAFTGSTAAGRRIASLAGAQLKRVGLELGGKSAAIVLADADPKTVAEGIRTATFANNGEMCVAHTRILAARERYAEIVAALAEMADGLVVGDPAKPDTFVGPIVRQDQYERVLSYLRLGVEEGARIAAGGAEPFADPELANGFYVRPTVFADVANDMRIAREEIFGPVLVVIPFDTEEEAIRLANDSDYGLSGGVWTADAEHGVEVARAVRTGTFHVNGAPRHGNAAFGGFKASGIGREYGSHGLAEFVEWQAIAVGR